MGFVKMAAPWCLTLAALASALAGQSTELEVVPPVDRTTAAESEAPSENPRAFCLGLAGLDLEAPGRFSLAATAGRAVVVERSESAPVHLAGGLSAALVYTADDRVPEALKMSFKPKTWDDFDTWEKLGYVLTKTGAAAGAAYLLYRIID